MPSRIRNYFPPYSTTRRTYSSTGALTATTVTNHPVPHAQYHPRQRYVATDWARTVNYKTKRQTQGYLPTLNLTQNRLDIRGDWIWNTFSNPTNPLQRIELEMGQLTVPQSIDYVESQTPLNSVRDALVLDAQYQCLSKARDMRINLPVFFGEGRQTVRMLTDTASTLFRSYRAFRKGKFNQAAKHLGIDKPTKALANNWLAYQYGWQPLLSDAVGAATMLYDYLEGNRKWGLRHRVSAFSVGGKGSRSDYVGGGSYSISGWNNMYAWDRVIVARAGLLLEVENTSAALAASLGVGLSDPLLTAWELTPFSFVFDWFVDVGSWLEARSSLQGLKVLAGYYTTETLYEGSTYMKYASGSYSKTAQPLPTWHWTTSRYIRKSWTGGITSVKMPLYDALNARRMTTSASLFRQRLGGDRTDGRYPLSPWFNTRPQRQR